MNIKKTIMTAALSLLLSNTFNNAYSALPDSDETCSGRKRGFSTDETLTGNSVANDHKKPHLENNSLQTIKKQGDHKDADTNQGLVRITPVLPIWDDEIGEDYRSVYEDPFDLITLRKNRSVYEDPTDLITLRKNCYEFFTTDLTALRKNLDACLEFFFTSVGLTYVNIKNEDGFSPLAIAVKMHREVSRDVCLTGKDDLISLRKGLDLVDLLLKAGAEVNARDNDGKTPLMYMAKVKHRNYQAYDCYDCNEDEMFSAEIERKRNTDSLNSLTELLVDAGADVNAKDNDGRTALMYYIQYVEWLGPLQLDIFTTGAIIDKKDNKGRTSLYWLCLRYNRQDWTSGGREVFFCMENLLSRGANPEEKDNNGISPKDIAVEHDFYDPVGALNGHPFMESGSDDD